MTYITYIEKSFQNATLDLITTANTIIEEYQAQGFSLTLRQLYYQMVARDILPNQQKEYKRLGSIISNGRRAGLISWQAIEDRTRNLRGNTHWSSPESRIRSAIKWYAIDKWKDQPYRPEVWIEKDALVGVIAGVCNRLDIDYFSCRGYTSDSEMWRAGHNRLAQRIANGQTPVIIHLGDHDPSGIDMTRDIVDRLELFSGADIDVQRVALNRDQIDRFQPPPNPAKLSDSRAAKYISIHGRSSWELDALDPAIIAEIIERTVMDMRDEDLWDEATETEEAHRQRLREMIKEN